MDLSFCANTSLKLEGEVSSETRQKGSDKDCYEGAMRSFDTLSHRSAFICYPRHGGLCQKQKVAAMSLLGAPDTNIILSYMRFWVCRRSRSVSQDFLNGSDSVGRG